MLSSSSPNQYQTNGVRIGYITPWSAIYDCIRKYIVAPMTLAEVYRHCPNPGLLLDQTTVVLQLLGIPLNKAFILAVQDGELGYLVNGTWHGYIGSLSRGEIDCTLPHLTPTLQRQDVVDFSSPVTTVPLGFLTR